MNPAKPTAARIDPARIAAGVVLVFGLLLAVFVVATRDYRWGARSERERGAPDAASERRLLDEEEKERSAGPARDSQPASTIAGIVVDEEGAPVPDLRLGAKEMTRLPISLANERQWGGSLEEAITDEAGRFEFAVDDGEAFGVRALDPGWAVKQGQLLRSGERDARLVVSPALSMTGTIEDRETGAPIPKARIEMTVTAENGRMASIMATATEGRIGLHWRIPPSARGGSFHLEVHTSADGYQRLVSEHQVLRGERQLTLGLRLDSDDPCAHLLEIVDVRGHAIDFPLRVGCGASNRRFEKAESGRLRFFAKAGPQGLEVRPAGPASPSVKWTGEVTLRPGREDLTRCVFPEFGVIRFKVPEREVLTVLMESVRTSHMHQFPSGAEGTYICAVGEWEIRRAGNKPRRVVVHDGDEIHLDLTDR